MERAPGPLVGHGGVGVLCINGIDLLEKYPIKDSQMGLDSGGT